MNKTLSIIIPTYNSENYIYQCLVLLECDSVDKSQVEVLIVDDASIDKTCDIIKEFCERNENFKLFRHSHNRGQGAARNTALAHCSGKYVWFVDSDDFINPSAMPYLLDRVSNVKSDIFVVQYEDVDRCGNRLSYQNNKLTGCVERIIDADEFYINNNDKCFAWMYVIDRSIIDNNNIFYRNIRAMQDVEFYGRLFTKCSCVYILDKLLYNYVQTPSSTTRSRTTEAVARRLKSMAQVHESLSSFVETEPMTDKMRAALRHRISLMEHMALHYYAFCRMPMEQARRVFAQFSQTHLYPFRWQAERLSFRNICYSAIRFILNRWPIVGRQFTSYLFIFVRSALVKMGRLPPVA